MVDEGKIAFTIAVELSYLKEEEQYELHAVMDIEQCTPSLSQANRLKRMSQKGELDTDEMYNILGEEKPNQREQIKSSVAHNIKVDNNDHFRSTKTVPRTGKGYAASVWTCCKSLTLTLGQVI
ncbi:hypothetical protein [Clostridium oryzae]|uniref:Uncharacterized protein n=1 Tax=Clostridium oryzae TaxID=1450648 RepID=A0A1V4IZ85_9CLOT|nr:hypothetical protein [Clostridium oryzae]OPJ65209.1 hypothetical protein CLORY_02090 [Clostridium oryzae]